MIFKYTKYPNAAKEYLRFMMEKEQYEPWQKASIGFVTQPLTYYEKNPVWTVGPEAHAYRDSMKNMLPNGYAGKLGYASAACMADFIVVNMVAEAAIGIEDAEGSGRAGAEARQAVLQGLISGAIAGHESHRNRAVVAGRAALTRPGEAAADRSCHACSTTATSSGCCSCCPRGALLLVFLTYPLGLGVWLGFTDAKVGRAGEWIGIENYEYLLGDSGLAAVGVQHVLLHGRRERGQVRARPVAGAAAERAHPVQGVRPRHRAAALHRAHGALGDRVLVDLRRAVLDHQLGAGEDRA